MAKLKQIVQQLKPEDYEAIYYALVESNSDKSAQLFKSLRQKQPADVRVMNELEVNSNAYYTLRSRLYSKIEEYLVQQMESPRADLHKKVATIQEVLFNRSVPIAVAALKRLERELIDYDLFKELTDIYKLLKKLHFHDQESHFKYSKLYNEHVALTLALDKAEDLLAEYFKAYGNYFLSSDPNDKLALTYLYDEMESVCDLYQSHRLFVYKSCMGIYHRLLVIGEEDIHDEQESIEDTLQKVDRIFQQYEGDIIYFNLKIVFEYLRLLYYNHYKVYRQFEKYYEDVNEGVESLLSHYSLYTFPPHFLLVKIQRAIRLGQEEDLHQERENLFQFYEPDENNLPNLITFKMYKAISSYYARKYEYVAKMLNDVLNTISFRKYPFALMELKSILALQYCMMRDHELFKQTVNSIHRQIRAIGKENCEDFTLFIKSMRILINKTNNKKSRRLIALTREMEALPLTRPFSPIRLIKLSEEMMQRLPEPNK